MVCHWRMTEDKADQNGQVLVRGAHRLIRMLDDQEGPYRGALVTCSESVAVQADAAALGGWRGWEHAGDEHVAGPLDLVRRPDGQDVLLPWCPETVIAFLARRTAAGAPLSAGETATLVGSLLRGLDELEGGADVRGGWWLTDSGRPLFVVGDGGDARKAAQDVVVRLVEGCQDRALTRTLGAVQLGLAQVRTPRVVQEGWERELFELAAPQPLQREVFAPERARDVAPRRAAFEAGADSVREGGWRGTLGTARQLLTYVGARLGALDGVRWPLTGRATATQEADDSGDAGGGGGLRTKVRGKEAPARGRRIVVAGLTAAAVLVVGLLWPTGSGGDADAETTGGRTGFDSGAEETPGAGGTAPTGDRADQASVEMGSPAAGPKASEAPDPPQADRDAAGDRDQPSKHDSDPVRAVEALLPKIDGCRKAEDPVCADAVAAGASGVVAALDGASATDEPPTLVDEYGDVAVIRLTGVVGGEAGTEAGGELMVVLVRLNDSWLVRDVYGVADQPE